MRIQNSAVLQESFCWPTDWLPTSCVGQSVHSDLQEAYGGPETSKLLAAVNGLAEWLLTAIISSLQLRNRCGLRQEVSGFEVPIIEINNISIGGRH